MVNKMYPVLLVKELDISIVGQKEYKEAVAMGIYTQCYKDSVKPIMVIGPTGSGKSFLFKILKKTLLKPEKYTIMSFNISRLTEEGVQGQDIDDIFTEYRALCESENNYEYRGLIHIDEIDKLIYPSYVSSGSGSFNRNSQTQHQLMQILDGETIAGVPTNNILFVFSGAFHQLDERKAEAKCKSIGFNSAFDENPVSSLCKDSLRNDLIEIGFRREFLGRINQIIKIDALNEMELKAILLHPTRGIIAQKKQQYASDGIELIVENDAIDTMISAVMEENLGARSVSNIVEKLLNGAWFNCIANDYNQIIVDAASVMDGKIKYKKIKKMERKLEISKKTSSE